MQRYNALGSVTDTFGYGEACKAAREWFAALDAGVVDTEKFTVRTACEEYVEDRTREKGKRCAYDASWRFRKYVFDAPIGAIEVAKLRAHTIKNWRDGLRMTKSGANRMTTTLKAALNLAVTNRRVTASRAIEWRSVKQHRNADRRREIYLDLPQRRALLEAATGGVIEAVLVTGARPGELASAPRSAFDSRTKTLTLSGKTGTRSIPLSPAAVTLFERLAKSKLPTAPLLTRDDGKAWKRPAIMDLSSLNRFASIPPVRRGCAARAARFRARVSSSATLSPMTSRIHHSTVPARVRVFVDCPNCGRISKSAGEIMVTLGAESPNHLHCHFQCERCGSHKALLHLEREILSRH
ncbi:MAG: tyrosine-type recombinase/integrase [Steroidobacteraceae bacterium]